MAQIIQLLRRKELLPPKVFLEPDHWESDSNSSKPIFQQMFIILGLLGETIKASLKLVDWRLLNIPISVPKLRDWTYKECSTNYHKLNKDPLSYSMPALITQPVLTPLNKNGIKLLMWWCITSWFLSWMLLIPGSLVDVSRLMLRLLENSQQWAFKCLLPKVSQRFLVYTTTDWVHYT